MHKIITVCALLLSSLTAFTQTYFDFYATNTDQSQSKKYQYNRCERCLFSGKSYDCTLLTGGGTLSNAAIDSLHNRYSKICPASAYQNRVPARHYYLKDSEKPYIIKTLYKIEGAKTIIMYQVKITFANTQHNNCYDVTSIEIFTPENAKKFDAQLVLTNYNQQLQDEKKSPPPPEVK